MSALNHTSTLSIKSSSSTKIKLYAACSCADCHQLLSLLHGCGADHETQHPPLRQPGEPVQLRLDTIPVPFDTPIVQVDRSHFQP